MSNVPKTVVRKGVDELFNSEKLRYIKKNGYVKKRQPSLSKFVPTFIKIALLYLKKCDDRIHEFV